MRISSVALLSCALLLLALTGCPDSGGVETPDLVPVSGTVKLDGEPVEGVSVMFGTSGVGESDATGRFELVFQGGPEKGVPVGDYTVTCEKWVMPDGSLFKSSVGDEGDVISPEMAEATRAIPAAYGSDESSGLTATVPAGGSDSIEIELTSEFAAEAPPE